MNKFIPVNEPLLGSKEKEYVVNCLDTNWISSEGRYVREFEDKFSEKIGRKYGLAVCNGSMALEAAVVALGIKEGDEVIIPSFTIISCASAVVKVGAIPVVIDSDPHTWNMTVSGIESKITSRTRAIMAVHIYGLPVDMDPILKLAKKHNLLIIEDAAEAIGLSYKTRPCGSFGDISIFSFYSNKLVTTGEGGFIATDNETIADNCKGLRNLYFDENKRFIHEHMGWNLRMSNIQAAIGLAQLEKLESHVKTKIRIGESYNAMLGNVAKITLPAIQTDYAKNIYWVYGILLNNETSMHAADAMRLLKEKNIGTRPFFYPIHLQPVFKNMGLFKNTNCPVSESLYTHGFYIPSGLGISDAQIEYVANAIKEIVK